MSLLNRILKSKQTEETPADRIMSLSTLSEAELFDIATSSSEVELQQEAVRKLAYGQALLKLALGTYPTRLTQAACQHIGSLLESDEGLINNLLKEPISQSDLINIIAYSPAAIEKVLAKIFDESILCDIAINGKTSPLRQQAAEKISSREVLENLLHAAKEKDRSVFKIIKFKLNEFKVADMELAQRKMKAESLCYDLGRLVKRDIDDVYKVRLSEIEAAWLQHSQQEISDCEDRFHTALAKCQNKLENQQAVEAAELGLAAELEDAKQNMRAVTNKLCRLAGKLYEAEVVNSELMDFYNNTQQELELNLSGIQAKDFPLETEIKTYKRVADRVKKLWLDLNEYGSIHELTQKLEAIKQIEINAGSSPDKTVSGEETKQRLNALLQHKVIFENNGLQGETPEIVSAGTAAISSWVEARHKEKEKRKKQLAKINELIRKANHEISLGHVRQARGIARDLEEKQKKYVGLPPNVLTKLGEIEEKIAKLGDWHDFAVQPKKQALVEKMEALAGSDLHPNEIAQLIKSMRSDWKLLCKGGENQDKELWERMQIAGEKAYEPCRKYFAEKAAEREQNFAKRAELIEQMNHYYTAYSWENAVWKDVEQTLKIAREAWQNLWPIPRSETKAQENSFNAIMDKVHNKIKEFNQANRDAKRKLVEQAEILAKQDDTVSAINAAKQLQAQWKLLGGSVGASRKEDQKLWEAFRRHCDVVFGKRDSEQAELKNKRTVELEKAKTILAKLDNMLKKTTSEFAEDKKGVKGIIVEFNALGELPKNEQPKIRDLFNKKLKLIEEKSGQERKVSIKKSWDSLFDIANEIRVFEELVLNGLEPSEALVTWKAQLKEQLKEQIEAIDEWPSGGQSIIESRLDQAQNLEPTTVADNERVLRTLCIRAEIFKGTESPKEDKSLRMEYQIQLLQQGYGLKSKITDTAESLSMEWIAVPGVAEAIYTNLTERFRSQVQY